MSTNPPWPPALSLASRGRGSCKRASRKRPAKQDLNDECDSPDVHHDMYTSCFDLPTHGTYEADDAEEDTCTGDGIALFGGNVSVVRDVPALLKEFRTGFSGSKRTAGDPDKGELITCALNGVVRTYYDAVLVWAT